MNTLIRDVGTAAIMRGLCDIADRARDEVRFHDRDWWKERCRYRLSDLGGSLSYAVRGTRLSVAGPHRPYEVCWLSGCKPAIGRIGRLELIAQFDEPGLGGKAVDFAELVHIRAARKLWLVWHDTLADAHQAFALRRRLVLDQDPQDEHATYLFASVVRERKRLHYSLLCVSPEATRIPPLHVPEQIP